jgi:hypothetical protein
MASPFSLDTVIHCHDVFSFFSLPYFSIRHSVAPYSKQYSPFRHPLTSLELNVLLTVHHIDVIT